MREASLQVAVAQMCDLYGIAWYHTHDSRRSPAGWPDLALCGAHGFITRELKNEYGKTTPEQERWGWMLRQSGISWEVWRPADLRSGRIQRELLAIK